MRVLLSTIGSRGDVQPVVGLASRLRALGQEVHLCVPPDFREWIEGLGLPVTPIGPNLRQTASAGHTRPTPEQLQRWADDSVAAQFATIREAAERCDLIVAGGALQVATRTIAELMDVPYVYASYCPVTLPSPWHAPPVYAVLGDTPAPAAQDYGELWAKDAQRYTTRFGGALNAHREAAGLPPVTDVRGHVFTDRPWLAADAVLAPWPDPADDTVFQTGAWILPDDRPLDPELAAFLEAGEPPVYLGFGSIRAPQGLSVAMITAARALGQRVIILRGWADLRLPDDAPDCLAIGEVNQQALFKRVAAVVHHGGAGTTTAAMRAGAPQVVLPQHYDQHYFAARVQELEIGTAHAPVEPTVDSLTTALKQTLQPEIAARAAVIAAASEMRGDGAQLAAERLIAAQHVSTG